MKLMLIALGLCAADLSPAQAQEPAAPRSAPEAPKPDLIGQVVVMGDPLSGNATTKPPLAVSAPFPTEALSRAVEGIAVIACTDASSFLPRCTVEKEEPAGEGLGIAALQLAAIAIKPTDGEVQRIPVVFTINGSPRAAMWAGTFWSKRPTGRAFDRHWPSKAKRSRIEARVELSCALRADRRVDCVSIRETPEGHGYAAAAIAIAGDFEMRQEAIGTLGFEVGDHLRIPISFRFTPPPAPSAP